MELSMQDMRAKVENLTMMMIGLAAKGNSPANTVLAGI